MNSKSLQNGIFKMVDGSSSFSINDVIMHGIIAFVKDFYCVSQLYDLITL